MSRHQGRGWDYRTFIDQETVGEKRRLCKLQHGHSHATFARAEIDVMPLMNADGKQTWHGATADSGCGSMIRKFW